MPLYNPVKKTERFSAPSTHLAEKKKKKKKPESVLNIHQFNVYLSKTAHNVFPRRRGDVLGEPLAGGKKRRRDGFEL